MEKAYILDTSVSIGALEQNSNPHVSGVAFSYGFKDRATSTKSYGGMSKQVVKTGVVPTEATVFELRVNTGVASDVNEGFSMTFVESIDRTVIPNVAGSVVAPFEIIHMYLNIGSKGAPTGFAEKDYFVLVKNTAGTKYELEPRGKATYDRELENWFKENYNNTPAIRFKCYPTAP